MNSLNYFAQMYAEVFGFEVFPIVPKNKKPLTKNGFKDASKNLDQINEWWHRWPNANIAIATGEKSNLFVLDIDDIAGENLLSDLEKQNNIMPDTLTAITSKGRHLYFKFNPNLLTTVRVLKGIDTRGSGGYVIAPPSIHPTGKIYEWKNFENLHQSKISIMPEWLSKILIEKKLDKNNIVNNFWKSHVCARIKEGNRNNLIASVSGHLFSKGINPHLTLTLIHSWNQAYFDPPLPFKEVNATIESIAKLERKKRGLI